MTRKISAAQRRCLQRCAGRSAEWANAGTRRKTSMSLLRMGLMAWTLSPRGMVLELTNVGLWILRGADAQPDCICAGELFDPDVPCPVHPKRASVRS